MATYTGADKRLAYLFRRTEDMTGATSEADGAQGIIPKPEAGDNLKFLRGDGTWAEAGEDIDERIRELKTPTDADIDEYGVATFKTLEADNLKALIVELTPEQDGSGDPSPTNIRRINGWTGCNVTVSPTSDPNDGTVYPVSWQTEAGTVYGGTVDFKTGVLTVTWAGVDMGNMTWALSTYSHDTTYLYVSNSVPDRKVSTSTVRPIGTLCEKYTYTGNYGPSYITNTLPDLSYCTRVSEERVYFRNDAITDATTFKNSVNGYYLVYQLEEDITYQLTPQEVKAYAGNNYVWAAKYVSMISRPATFSEIKYTALITEDDFPDTSERFDEEETKIGTYRNVTIYQKTFWGLSDSDFELVDSDTRRYRFNTGISGDWQLLSLDCTVVTPGASMYVYPCEYISEIWGSPLSPYLYFTRYTGGSVFLRIKYIK